MQLAEKLHLTLIQADLFWEDKEANISMFEKKIVASPDSDIFVLPEMFNTGFTNNSESLAEEMDGVTTTWMLKMAREQNAVICGSIIILESELFYNRFIWADPNGSLNYYDKRHLFAMAGEADYFSPGKNKTILTYKGWKINLQICYDLRFPVWSRRTSQEDYDVLIYVASWPITRVHAWTTLLKARAIENQCYTVGVNRIGKDGQGFEYSGATALYDPLGEDLAITEPGKEETLHCVINYKDLMTIRKKLPFSKDQDPFLLS